MSGIEYRVYVDDQPASRELAQAIDEIEVSQLTGAAWEAQLVIPICMDRHGQWDHEAEHYVTGRTRFRIELHAAGTWVTLIDGTTIGVDLGMSGDPGQSTVTVFVQDHTAELDRDRFPRTFGEGNEVEDVIRSLLSDRAHIDYPPEIDVPASEELETLAPHELTKPEGSCYDYLKELASERGRYVYVLPTETRGRSRAYFGPLPQPSGDRGPPLVLAGPDRNVEGFQVATERERPGRAEVRFIDVRNRTVETRAVQLRDTAMGDQQPAGDDDVDAIIQRGHAAAVGPDAALAAALEEAGYAIRATGSVEGRCYPGVLRPYSHVDVTGIPPTLAGTYLVHSVTHHLSRAGYRQAFTMWRRTVSTANGTAQGGDAS